MQKRILVCCLLFFALATARAQQARPALMPWPDSVRWTGGKYRLSDRFQASLQCDAKDEILTASANRIFQGLNRKTGLYFRQALVTPGKDLPGAGLSIL